ncbi:MAG: hypothetical protein AB3N06_07325 [Erythrobacter sp.]
MIPRSRRSRLAAFVSASLAITACGAQTSDKAGVDEEGDSDPRGTYDIDRETGETSARYVDEAGTTTTMRSGQKVPVSLPQNFTVFPGATVTNNTRVERAGGQLVLLALESEATPDEMIAHYRAQAEAAGIDVAMALETGATQMIGGERPDGTSFSFTAKREEDLTEAQLSIGRGLE